MNIPVEGLEVGSMDELLGGGGLEVGGTGLCAWSQIESVEVCLFFWKWDGEGDTGSLIRMMAPVPTKD